MIDYYELYNAIKRYELNFVSLDNVIDNLKKFHKSLLKASTAEIAQFYMVHIDNVHYMYKSTVEFARDTNSGPLRSWIDKTFKNIIHIDTKAPKQVTVIFKEFIKGITYFEAPVDNQSQPIYHRALSCGPKKGSEDFRKNNLQCTPAQDMLTREDIKKRTETCYIERLIYDELWKEQALFFPRTVDEEPGQDKGHEDYLHQEVHEDYKTCFPNHTIKVTLEFSGMYPIKATIVKIFRNRETSVEIYKKDIVVPNYVNLVECSKQTAKCRYSKVQDFQVERNWLKE